MNEYVNDAIILAAGKGSRMKKNDKSLIKPLIKVNGKILIGHIIEALISSGIENIHIISSVHENITSVIKSEYPNINFNFYYHNSDNTAIVALKLVEEQINKNFILADCDIICDINALAQTISENKKRLNEVDGLVACAINPKFVNNHYLKIDNTRIIGFDKNGDSKNLHGGFIYIFNDMFYNYLNQNTLVQDMAVILDGYFKNYNVSTMFIDDIWDIDEEAEIADSEKLLNSPHN